MSFRKFRREAGIIQPFPTWGWFQAHEDWSSSELCETQAAFLRGFLRRKFQDILETMIGDLSQAGGAELTCAISSAPVDLEGRVKQLGVESTERK